MEGAVAKFQEYRWTEDVSVSCYLFTFLRNRAMLDLNSWGSVKEKEVRATCALGPQVACSGFHQRQEIVVCGGRREDRLTEERWRCNRHSSNGRSASWPFAFLTLYHNFMSDSQPLLPQLPIYILVCTEVGKKAGKTNAISELLITRMWITSESENWARFIKNR